MSSAVYVFKCVVYEDIHAYEHIYTLFYFAITCTLIWSLEIIGNSVVMHFHYTYIPGN